jgi:hypothetical protein
MLEALRCVAPAMRLGERHMPIEIKELHIKVVVTDRGESALLNGGDEMYRTQYGNNNAYNLDPDDEVGDLSLAATRDDGGEVLSGWGSSSYQYGGIGTDIF